MKICLVNQHNADIKEVGGAETYLRYLSKGLRAIGHEVSFATSDNEVVANQKSGCDIFHFHNVADSHIGDGAVRYLKGLHIPYLFTLHDYWAICPSPNRMMIFPDSLNPFKHGDRVCEVCDNMCGAYQTNPYWNQLLRHAVCICQTPSSQKMFQNHGFLNTKLIHNCMNPEIFSPGEFDENNKKVMFICAHGAQKWKGWEKWLEIKSIVGDKAEFVEVLGGVPNTEMPAKYREAAVFVFCSMYNETTGMAALEAQSCGIPVVAFASGGLKDNVIDSSTGFVVERGRSDCAAQCIVELMEHPDMRKRMGEAGRKHIIENFNIEDMVKMHEDLYLEVLSGQADYKCLV
ncbi:MAG: glycosyltransferase [Candidatus Izemoplasmatales bacterium]|jgi:glycosyltransferase involved in cell wall biosynthesis